MNSDWGSGFSGSISITNNTDTTLEDWTLEFDFAREITSIWNATVESYEDNHYVMISYKLNGNQYEYTLRFTLYDIYGLDSADIEEKKAVDNVLGFGILAGFRSWYILQHCNLYNGEYKPFITYMVFERTITGSI